MKTRFKRHVATFLDHMGIGEFELTAREQFEAKKGRLLTSDEKACFSHVFDKTTKKVETTNLEEEEESD